MKTISQIIGVMLVMTGASFANAQTAEQLQSMDKRQLARLVLHYKQSQQRLHQQLTDLRLELTRYRDRSRVHVRKNPEWRLTVKNRVDGKPFLDFHNELVDQSRTVEADRWRVMQLDMQHLLNEHRRTAPAEVWQAEAGGVPVLLLLWPSDGIELESATMYAMDGRLRCVAGLHVLDVYSAHELSSGEHLDETADGD